MFKSIDKGDPCEFSWIKVAGVSPIVSRFAAVCEVFKAIWFGFVFGRVLAFVVRVPEKIE